MKKRILAIIFASILVLGLACSCKAPNEKSPTDDTQKTLGTLLIDKDGKSELKALVEDTAKLVDGTSVVEAVNTIKTQLQAAAFRRQFAAHLLPEQSDMLTAWSSNIDEKSYLRRLNTIIRNGFCKNDFLRTLGLWFAA